MGTKAEMEMGDQKDEMFADRLQAEQHTMGKGAKERIPALTD
jgi:hypothetical protein